MNNSSFFEVARDRFRTGVAEIDRKWRWYLALGIFLIILGWIAAGSAIATTVLSVTVFGWVLLVAGAALIVLSFLTGNWGGFLLSLGAGALSIIAGIAILNSPLAGAAAITLMIGTILVAVGIFRSIASIVMQFSNWGWALLSGIVSFVLGALLLKNWQTASLWFLGLYIGIDLMFHGLSWIMFSLGVHNVAKGLTGPERRVA
jgi:uncharacterized membrane protein HdeD (DUF308 family)